ncbi:uncharacterized protein H6S33_008961 [Morchella sextelata]|uniref:uncharacterized protein n=1 Tax=Morchella sextelata TaxID=1174677 RepID=UPI001D047FEE|nr:uncharacterized protein H6S33_008961 [Morchella sextelata]KAH0612581.1 hypothetical protein H6S33_008961 [Morchella sextelata]
MSSGITKTSRIQLEAETPDSVEKSDHTEVVLESLETAKQRFVSNTTVRLEAKDPLMTAFQDPKHTKKPADCISTLNSFEHPNQEAMDLGIIISPRKSPYLPRRPSFSCSPTRQRFPYISLIPPYYLPTTITHSPAFRRLYPGSYTIYQLYYSFLSTTLPLPFSFRALLSGTLIGGHGINAIENGDIYGRIPLTRLVFESLGSLGEEIVMPWLRGVRGLRWIFEQDISDLGPVELTGLKGIKVRVATATVNINVDIDEMEDPKWTFYECVTEGTEGRLA